MVRFGYAYGGGFAGFKYFSRRMAFKSGGAERREAYIVEEKYHARIRNVLDKLGIDVCHIDAIPIGDELLIIDINPLSHIKREYPLADHGIFGRYSGTAISVRRDDSGQI